MSYVICRIRHPAASPMYINFQNTGVRMFPFKAYANQFDTKEDAYAKIIEKSLAGYDTSQWHIKEIKCPGS